jgi:hypothetical protein
MTSGSAYSNDDDRRSRHLFHHGVIHIHRVYKAAFDYSVSEKHVKIHCNDNTVAGNRTLPPGQNTKTMKGRAVFTVACRFQQGKLRNCPDHAEFFRPRISQRGTATAAHNDACLQGQTLTAGTSRLSWNRASASRVRLRNRWSAFR